MNRIYILGEARGSYRIQGFVKLLLDNRKKYKVHYDSLLYDIPVIRYLKSLIINPFVILFSNIVYVNTLDVDINIFYELLWAKLFRKKILVDYYVSVYDTVVLDRKWFKENSFLAKLAQFCDKIFCFCGTKLIFLTENEKQYYLRISHCEKYSIKAEIITLGIERRAKVECGFVYNGKKELSVCWWGSYQPLHGIDKILLAAKLLKEKSMPVHFYFFGNDPKKSPVYQNMIKEYGLEDTCFLSDDYTFANGKLEPFLKEHCDLALGAFGDSIKSKTVIINKAIEACTMNCLVLTGRSSGMEEYFDNGKSSIYICESTSEGIAEKIEEIINTDPTVLKDRIVASEKCYRQNFEMHVMTKAFENLIDLINVDAVK